MLAKGLLAGAVGARAYGHLRLTIVSAKLDPKKMAATGHMSTASLSDLDCLALPGLRDYVEHCGGAQAAADDASGKNELDPVVRIEIGDRVIRTYPVPNSATPRFDYAAILDRAALENGDSALFQVIDYNGAGDESVLAKKLVTNKTLLAPGTRTVAVGGASVTYRIEVVSSEPRTYHYRVAGDQQFSDLAKKATIAVKSSDGNYVAIPVAEGETVSITATGKVRPSAKKHPDIVAGPDGIPTKSTKIQYNQPGFRSPGVNHAALIGQLGPDGFVVGSKKSVTAKTSGLLLLGVNDLKVSDNDGGYDVTVTVTPPASAQGESGGVKKGSAGDAGPSGLDPRVVEQVVDAHSDEMDACVQSASNPYGSLVLQFSISADGSPLGVIVTDASPNLKDAGDCMRKKALAWRFPPPHGVVTAKYPLSFSAS